MVRVSDPDDSSWRDRTSAGHLRLLMGDDMSYDDGADQHHTDTLEGMMQCLYDEVHLAAVDKYPSYVYTWFADELPTDYTIEEVEALLPRCFYKCKIESTDKYEHVTKYGYGTTEKQLVWRSITITWFEEEEEEEDEVICYRCDKPGHNAESCCQTKDAMGHKLDG